MQSRRRKLRHISKYIQTYTIWKAFVFYLLLNKLLFGRFPTPLSRFLFSPTPLPSAPPSRDTVTLLSRVVLCGAACVAGAAGIYVRSKWRPTLVKGTWTESCNWALMRCDLRCPHLRWQAAKTRADYGGPIGPQVGPAVEIPEGTLSCIPPMTSSRAMTLDSWSADFVHHG